MVDLLDPTSFVIARRRKKYRFALFFNSPLCFEIDEWDKRWQPATIEVGAGTGLFSVERATDAKENFLAVDVKADRLQKGARLASERSLSNIRFLRARADQLPSLFLPASLESIWVTFPDPFPKGRADKHRLTHQRFLRQYAELLVPGGSLLFKTDAKDLFTWSLEQLVREGWTIQELTFDLHASDLTADYKVMTTYEQKFYADELPIHFVRAVYEQPKH